MSAKIKLQELKLFSFKGNLYPADDTDYGILKQRGVLIYRIPETSLAQLQKTALTKLSIVSVPFSDMWAPFAESFASGLKKHGKVKTVTQHEFWVLLEPQGDDEKRLNSYLSKMAKFVHRYCIKMAIDMRREESELRLRIKFVYNEEINNSYAFHNSPVANESCTLDLTSCLRLVVTSQKINDTPFITVQIQDKLGDHWSDYMNRTGRISDIPKEQFTAMASYFLNLS